jgi:hypothetical protein
MNGLSSVSKAIAGAIVTALVAFLARHNLVLDQSINNAITVLVAAVIGFAGVYVAPKNTP